MWWLLGAMAALAVLGRDNTEALHHGGTYHSPQVASRIVTYRSRDGMQLFRFRFATYVGGIQIYILKMPPHGSCHVLRDHYGPFICWSGAIRSMAAAEAVAAMWAEATLEYQRTGRSF